MHEKTCSHNKVFKIRCDVQSSAESSHTIITEGRKTAGHLYWVNAGITHTNEKQVQGTFYILKQ